MIVKFHGFSGELRALNQHLTYGGLLEGHPTVETNQRSIDSILHDSENRHYDVEPYLVPPVEKLIEFPADEPYPYGTPSMLPKVTCIGRFESAPTDPKWGDGSGLVVIWFQENFALPIDSEVLLKMSNLDWARYAGDFQF